MPPSAPTALKLSKLWSSTEVRFPGNLLLLGAADSKRVLAVENSMGVAELAEDGKVVARHALDIPRNVAISFVRTAVDGKGNRIFAAFASAQQQVYLFDADWKQIGVYPSAEQHPGLSDAQLADLDGDGQLELAVGYWGPLGVQTASLGGNLLHSNRSFENLMHLIVVGPNPSGQSRLLLANGQDSLHWLNPLLESDGEIPTPNRAVHTLLARAGDGQIEQIAALSSTEVGATTALALGADGSEQWSYELPRGVQKLPVETIVSLSVNVPASYSADCVASSAVSAWLFPGADGSLHFVGADGKLIDKFNYGAELSGLTWGELGGHAALVVATPKDITAWALDGG